MNKSGSEAIGSINKLNPERNINIIKSDNHPDAWYVYFDNSHIAGAQLIYNPAIGWIIKINEDLINSVILI